MKVRNQNKGTIRCTSRDFQERDENIFFDPITCTWNVPSENNVIVENLTRERQRIIEAMEEINKECTPLQIANIVGGTSKNISNMLSTMKTYGFVESGSKRGLWRLPLINDNNYEIE